MRRILVLLVSTAINASTIPGVAVDSTSNKDIDVTRMRSATVHSQLADTADNEKACRACVASFYGPVTLRQAAVRCADGERTLALLDSAINAFDDLLATKSPG